MWRVAACIGGVAFGRPLIGSVLGSGFAAPALILSDRPREVPAVLAQEPMNSDVLAWWKLRDHNEAADPSTGRPEGLPHLARMVRQWLGAPATSAGVERLFSKAGSMHHDLKGSMEDGSPEHSLIATANSE
jgi:hypothetical protein